MQRILCVNPEHQESNPSMVVYEEWAHCYSCGYRVPVSSLKGVELRPARKAPPEDLEQALAYIKTLPLTPVRGLMLPADQEGFYLVWPCGRYFKKRRWVADNKNKYKNPRGHTKPLYISWQVKSNTLVLVEGEINALSLAQLKPNYTIVSPGSASDFSAKILDQIGKLSLGITRYRVILDLDKAGLEAAIRIRPLLLKRTPYVQVTFMERDLNELLVSGELAQEAARLGLNEQAKERR